MTTSCLTKNQPKMSLNWATAGNPVETVILGQWVTKGYDSISLGFTHSPNKRKIPGYFPGKDTDSI